MEKHGVKGLGSTSKATDRIPCAICFVRYCDYKSGDSWIQCQQCDAWFHNACQELDETGETTFVCISCEND